MMAQSTMEQRNEFEKKKNTETTVIPVVHEKAIITKKTVDTAKVFVRKRVTEEETTLNIPLIHEGFTIEHVPVNQIVATPPAVRQEGDTTIIPVLREVLVVEKRYELVEEVHVTKKKTVVPHVQEITLRKEVVEVERKPLQDGNQL